jgi:L-ascorbate metabolism protein UlaG (beta-lactamase superfamily)
MRDLIWVGHSTVLVELDGVRMLTDPLLRNRVAHLRRLETIVTDAVTDVDAVLVSHGHYDHLDAASLRLLDDEIPVVAPRGLGGALRRAGRRRIVEVEEGDEVPVGPVSVRATPAEHGGPTLRKGSALGFAIRGSASVYFAGDTDLFEAMSGIGPVDVALVPVWGWGRSIGPGHLDPRRAAQAVAMLRARVSIPIHWGTYRPVHQRAGPFLTEPPLEFRRAVAELAPETRVEVLPVGGKLDLQVVGAAS